MIANNDYNRSILRKYLNSISEDNFIDEVIIPLFSKSGYLLFRRNIHGPGEHGKDLVFYRHVKLFYDNEYIVVQAKADPVNARNVSKYADQLVRALKVPFPAGKGKSELFANYVYFINSRTHTNDVNFEFQYLADMRDNIKIIDGDRTVELMIDLNLIPEPLKGKIEEYESSSEPGHTETYDITARKIILEGDNKKINKLLDYDLKIYSSSLSVETKRLIINYIFNKWEEDSSWDGTVKPMKWLKQYFDFIQDDQYNKLEKVFDEYLSSYHSYAAESDTASVVEKITPLQIKSFEESFIKKTIDDVRSNKGRKHYLVIQKFRELVVSGLLSAVLQNIAEVIEDVLKLYDEIRGLPEGTERSELIEKSKVLDGELYYFLYPEERVK